ncbi:MAG TPA: hypothetical protein VK144_01400 [Bacillota bacterium]|nr:hypothetical protein [Bacillota bacterium]
MDKKHTEIIVQEIKYWKEHHLLPEESCDFLLALYTQGEQSVSVERKKEYTLQNVSLLMTLFCLIPLSFIITYFTDFYPILQIGIFFLFISFSFWTYFTFKKEHFPYQYIAFLTALILILYTSVFITRMYTQSDFIMKCVILVNFSSWLWLGWRNQLKYVLIIGCIALLFLLSWIILQKYMLIL